MTDQQGQETEALYVTKSLPVTIPVPSLIHWTEPGGHQLWPAVLQTLLVC